MPNSGSSVKNSIREVWCDYNTFFSYPRRPVNDHFKLRLQIIKLKVLFEFRRKKNDSIYCTLRIWFRQSGKKI